jgi:RNase P/RNase MRP subunit p29
MITKQNLNTARGELIGTQARVTRAANPSIEGLVGMVVNETKHFITLDTSKGRKRVPKRTCTFLFKAKGKETEIEGCDIEIAPEERIKLKVQYGKNKKR